MKQNTVDYTLFPEKIFPPECWGWEFEYLIAKLFDYLGTCKKFDCLAISSNVANSLNKDIPICNEFQRCVVSGCRELHQFLLKKYPIVTGPQIYFQTPTMVAMLHACCIDDVNLGYIFDILRIAEILENNTLPLNVREKARLLCAIIGEIHHVSDSLKISSQSERKLCTQFLDETLGLLLDLLCETGRDRATYIKEKYTRPPLNLPSSSRLPLRSSYLSDTSPDKKFTNPTLTTQMNDPCLADYLMSGSLISIWGRLEQLWNPGAPRFYTCHSNTRLHKQIYNQILSTFSYSASRMGRYRRILVTRLLEMLCVPMILNGETIRTSAFPTSELLEAIIKGLLQGFPQGAWPYENEAQKKSITSCRLISPELQKALENFLTVPDSLHFMHYTPTQPTKDNSPICYGTEPAHAIDPFLFSNSLKKLLP